MKIIAVLGCALLLAGLARADIYTASMDQARRAVSKTEAASNQNPDGQPSQNRPPSQTPQPMDPALAATLKNIASLRVDLTSLDFTNPPSGALTNDMAAAATGTKPPPEKIAQLFGDLQTAIAGKASVRAHFLQLAQFLHAVCNGSHLTPAQFQMVSDGVEQILDNAGASYETTLAVLHDLKAIYRATQ
jgi:hypothetical protein